MAKKVGLKIGTAIAVGVGLYFFYTSDWYKSRYTGFFKKRKKVRDENVLITTTPPANTTPTSLGGIYIYNNDGSVISEYNYTGNNMEFPLQNSSGKYDNVAELQAFLVFANPDNNLAIDGYFGPFTSQAVLDETEGLVNYGYDADDYDYETVTEAYFNEVVIPELEYFMNADCITLYDEETCA